MAHGRRRSRGASSGRGVEAVEARRVVVEEGVLLGPWSSAPRFARTRSTKCRNHRTLCPSGSCSRTSPAPRRSNRCSNGRRARWHWRGSPTREAAAHSPSRSRTVSFRTRRSLRRHSDIGPALILNRASRRRLWIDAPRTDRRREGHPRGSPRCSSPGRPVRGRSARATGDGTTKSRSSRQRAAGRRSPRERRGRPGVRAAAECGASGRAHRRRRLRIGEFRESGRAPPQRERRERDSTSTPRRRSTKLTMPAATFVARSSETAARSASFTTNSVSPTGRSASGP